MFRSILTFSLFASSAIAQDMCPTRTDLENGGIVFQLEDVTEIHSTTPNGLIQIETMTRPNSTRLILAHGLHLLEVSEVARNAVILQSIVRTNYPISFEDLPEPRPNQSWESPSVLESRGNRRDQLVEHQWGRLGAFTVGDCVYESIPVTVSYIYDTEQLGQSLVYLPELGTALLVGSSSASGSLSYAYLSVSSVE